VVFVSDRLVALSRPGRATRRKWRIPDGKVESGLFLFLELQRWYPLPVSIVDRSSDPGEQD
jgi:hypothetical protein